MHTLESIRGLLEQSEGKLNAARESISIANTNTINDTSALNELRTSDEEELIVPILDEVIEPELLTDNSQSIPELDAIVPPTETQVEDTSNNTEKQQPTKITETSLATPELSSLSQKNQIISALDEFQMELEQSLRETLMKTMVSLEKELKDKIEIKISDIKSKILE